MNYDDETLMAYADGELDEARRAEIAAAVERDPLLARRVEHHRALRAEIAGAYAPVLDQPVPEHLRAAARGRSEHGAVLQFPVRGASPKASPWRGWEWGAIAASLVLGGLISWKMFAPTQPGLMSSGASGLVAQGSLAHALDKQLASSQRSEDEVQIGLTFLNRDGHYCRSFALPKGATAGLACRVEGEWRIPVVATAKLPAGDLRPAASLPAPVLAAIEASIVGEALDAAGEQEARLSGWDNDHR